MCISTWRNLDAFTGPHSEVMPNAAEIFFAQHVFDHIDRLKNALYVVITWISDLFLVRSCLKVSGSPETDTLVAVPLLHGLRATMAVGIVPSRDISGRLR